MPDLYANDFAGIQSASTADTAQRQQALQSAMVNFQTATAAAANRKLQQDYIDKLSGGPRNQQLMMQVMDHAAENGDDDTINKFRGKAGLPNEVVDVYSERAKQNQQDYLKQHQAVNSLVNQANRQNQLNYYIKQSEQAVSDTPRFFANPADIPKANAMIDTAKQNIKDWQAELDSTDPRANALIKQYREAGAIGYDPDTGFTNLLPRRSFMDRMDRKAAAASGGGGEAAPDGSDANVPGGETAGETPEAGAGIVSPRSMGVTPAAGRFGQPADYEAAAYGTGDIRGSRLTPEQRLAISGVAASARLEPGGGPRNRLPNGDTVERGLLKLRALKAATPKPQFDPTFYDRVNQLIGAGVSPVEAKRQAINERINNGMRGEVAPTGIRRGTL